MEWLIAVGGLIVAALALLFGWDDRRRYLYAGERLAACTNLIVAATRYADRIFEQREAQQSAHDRSLEVGEIYLPVLPEELGDVLERAWQACDLAAGPGLTTNARELRDAAQVLGPYAYVAGNDGEIFPEPRFQDRWPIAWKQYSVAAATFIDAVKRELETDRLSPLGRLERRFARRFRH